MIKRFCDICGEQMTKSDFEKVYAIDEERKVGWQLSVMPNKGYNGDICNDCAFASFAAMRLVIEEEFDKIRRGWNCD